jgi:hypothetical protein
MTLSWQRRQEVERFISHALEASVYVNPRDYGLTESELIEAGARHGFQSGEIRDALHRGSADQFEFYVGERATPKQLVALSLVDFNWTWDGDPRNRSAYQYVLQNLEDLARTEGVARAKVARDSLIARSESAGYSRKDIELAIASYLIYGMLQGDDDGILSHSRNRTYASPNDQLKNGRQSLRANPPSPSLVGTVADVIERRGDGRPKHAEPLDAFAELLGSISKAQYRLWWNNTCSELRRMDPTLAPTSTLVLAAALAEGALALVAGEIRNTGRSMTGKLFDRDPKEWKLLELVAEAYKGERPVFTDPALRDRCKQLNLNRQRIHAGRFLSLKVPAPQIDIRPDEARQAKETLEQVLRSVLDWFVALP